MRRDYMILNGDLQVIGSLSVNGPTHILSDSITHQWASTDDTNTSYGENYSTDETTQDTGENRTAKNYDHSGTITVLQGEPDADKITTDNYIGWYDDQLDRWYIFKIWHTTETQLASGAYSTQADVVNAGLYDLANYVPKNQTLKNVNAAKAFKAFTDHLYGWRLDLTRLDTSYRMSEIEFSGSDKGSSVLQTLLQDYNLECDFYVKVTPDGYVYEKVFEVGTELNSDIFGGEAYIGKNVTALTREVSGNVVTLLYVYGPNGETMATANSGKTFVVDDAANKAYNPNWENGYYEYSFTSSTVTDAKGLWALGKKILKAYNHPRRSYTLQLTHTFNPVLGSTVRTKDFYITPELTTEERVVSKTISLADISQCTASFGEFTTITRVIPGWLSSVSSSMQRALREAMKDSASITPVILTPDGLDFDQQKDGITKRAIIQAWEGNTNISSYFSNKGFVFRQIATTGAFETTSYGYLQNVSSLKLGEYRATIDNTYLSSDPEVKLDQGNAKEILELNATSPSQDRKKTEDHSEQYCVQLKDGSWLTSTAATNNNDTIYQKWSSNGAWQSAQRVHNGGHGSMFGVDESDGNIWIIGVTKNESMDSAHSEYRVCKWKYTGQDITSTVVQSTSNFIVGWGDSGSLRVGYDQAHNYVLITRDDNTFEVVKPDEIFAGKHNVLYSGKLADYGIDFGTQTFQSATLNFPYLYFHEGAYKAEETEGRMIFGCNVVHLGETINTSYDFSDTGFNIEWDLIEPETIWAKDDYLIVSFNLHNEQNTQGKTHKHGIYKLPLIFRDKEVTS